MKKELNYSIWQKNSEDGILWLIGCKKLHVGIIRPQNDNFNSEGRPDFGKKPLAWGMQSQANWFYYFPKLGLALLLVPRSARYGLGDPQRPEDPQSRHRYLILRIYRAELH